MAASRASRELARLMHRNGLLCNTRVKARALIVQTLRAPRSGSVHGTNGAGGARRLQAPTPTGVAVVSVGAGSSPPPADGVPRALRARVRPVAPRRGAGHGQLPPR